MLFFSCNRCGKDIEARQRVGLEAIFGGLFFIQYLSEDKKSRGCVAFLCQIPPPVMTVAIPVPSAKLGLLAEVPMKRLNYGQLWLSDTNANISDIHRCRTVGLRFRPASSNKNRHRVISW